MSCKIKHAATYQLSANGRQVRPRGARAETYVLEYATPDIVKKAGFKGMMEQLEKLTAAQTLIEDRLLKTEDKLLKMEDVLADTQASLVDTQASLADTQASLVDTQASVEF